MAPKGTPPAVLDKANGIIRTAFQAQEIRLKLAALGVDFAPSTPAELDAFIAAERRKWGTLIRERGLKADQ